jgi:hypothetical protein
MERTSGGSNGNSAALLWLLLSAYDRGLQEVPGPEHDVTVAMWFPAHRERPWTQITHLDGTGKAEVIAPCRLELDRQQVIACELFGLREKG